MTNLTELVPESKPFKMVDLNGRIVRLEYKEEKRDGETLKLLLGHDVSTLDVYVIFYELGFVKEDA